MALQNDSKIYVADITILKIFKIKNIGVTEEFDNSSQKVGLGSPS